MEVWAKLYALEVEVEVEWMDDISMENSVLSAQQCSMVKPVPPQHRRLKEVQSMGYIQDLIFLDL